MKLISTLIFLLCVTFAFAECYDNHFDECRIERQNGKYGIVIDKQLAIPYEYDEIVPQHNCFFKVRKGRKYGIISYFYEKHKRDGRLPKEIGRPIALKKGYAWLYLSLACEYDKIEEYENQFLQISRDDRKGIVNYYGTVILPCRFEKIELSNNYFWVSSEGLYGIYNRYGSTIIPCRYEQIELTDRCFYVCRDRLKGVYNRYGSVIIPCQFSQIECKDNAYYVTKGKYQGIYNLYGSVIVPTQYTSIYKEGGEIPS
ncbi:MAG TPA: WG repeat-containing protein [Odoribacter splanchnicus]|nr:WG repeat-containing protein [Odoribacter splanchnicus]HJG20145.1 WG repeat-containing protein [Odoribacter splanchnicus]